MPFTNKEQWINWSSEKFYSNHRYEAWYSALNESHLDWRLTKPNRKQFSAEVKMRHLGGVRILQCKSDPCSGFRSEKEIGKSAEAYFGLLFILDGSELVKSLDQTAVLKKGTLLLWDSTQPVEFCLLEPLHKVTLLIPQHYIFTRVPQVSPFIGKPFNVDSGLGAITAAHVISLAYESSQIEKGQGDSLVDLTLELLATFLHAQTQEPLSKSRVDLLQDIKLYIDKHLEDPDLCPTSIAKHFNLSTRYLHLLFKDTNVTVSKSIQQKRLEQCRRDLIRGGRFKAKITDVAFQWGFNDSSHFSRVFKNYYGLSPQAYQQRHFGCNEKSG